MQNFIIRPYRNWAAKALLALLICCMTGCSIVRMGYNHGETITYWWLNGYLDFESDQKTWVKKDIDDLFAWHRKTQLKDYTQLLARAQQSVDRPATQADMLAYYDDLKKRAMLVIDRSLPDLADLALSLQPDQIAHLEKKFASNNDTYRKDYLRGDIEQRQKFRFKKAMEQAEYWFGSFSNEQEALIRQTSDARPLNNELWMAERLRRQKDMIAMLKKIHAEKPSREAVMAMLKKYAASVFDPTENAEQQAFFDSSREASARLAAAVINCTTPEQKARAKKNLQKWSDSFNALAAAPA